MCIFHEKTFPEKTTARPPAGKTFPAPLGACHDLNYPAQTKKKEKIGTIFWEQTFRFVTPKGPFKFREALDKSLAGF
jgi:hypothetical protein